MAQAVGELREIALEVGDVEHGAVGTDERQVI
jgi:hypothetical protein